jgi:hypothetical protein
LSFNGSLHVGRPYSINRHAIGLIIFSAVIQKDSIYPGEGIRIRGYAPFQARFKVAGQSAEPHHMPQRPLVFFQRLRALAGQGTSQEIFCA